MTVIKLSDIRENDVHESAGMSNIPWEIEYGFQRSAEAMDDQCDVLEEVYRYSGESIDDSVLDGLSPDAPKRIGNSIVCEGTFNTLITVQRGDDEVRVVVQREWLILKANDILRDAATLAKVEVQREYIHEGPSVHVVYEVHPDEVLCLVIGDDAIPLRQLLDLRGFSVIGKIGFEDDDD